MLCNQGIENKTISSIFQLVHNTQQSLQSSSNIPHILIFYFVSRQSSQPCKITLQRQRYFSPLTRLLQTLCETTSNLKISGCCLSLRDDVMGYAGHGCNIHSIGLF